MSRSRRVCMMFLLAVWLVATQHCGLVAAGVWDSLAPYSAAACLDHGDECDSDLIHNGCTPAEKGSVASSFAVKVPAPQVHDCLSVFVLTLEAMQPVAEPVSMEAAIEPPLGWVPIWHFERRAAPSPRAPSSILA